MPVAPDAIIGRFLLGSTSGPAPANPRAGRVTQHLRPTSSVETTRPHRGSDVTGWSRKVRDHQVMSRPDLADWRPELGGMLAHTPSPVLTLTCPGAHPQPEGAR